ncbi:SLC13 family permease [Sesbania bispinosa]|nr:SLC13 family permease [Sesbania bispinosa]
MMRHRRWRRPAAPPPFPLRRYLGEVVDDVGALQLQRHLVLLGGGLLCHVEGSKHEPNKYPRYSPPDTEKQNGEKIVCIVHPTRFCTEPCY